MSNQDVPLILWPADQNVVVHADAVVIREPVFAGHLVERESHHLVEDIIGIGKYALAGEDRHAVGGDHSHRPIRHAHPARGHTSASRDAEGAVRGLDPGDVNIDSGGLGGARVADQHPHAHQISVDILDEGVIICRVPVFSGELVVGIAHDFIERVIWP